MEIIIFGTLPSLNEYIADIQKRKHGTSMKRECQEFISWFIPRNKKTFKNRVILHFDFYEPNLKRDTDNISSTAHKFIQDALVNAGILKDDSQRYIKGHVDNYYVDRENPRIVVTIEETDEDAIQPKGFRKLNTKRA